MATRDRLQSASSPSGAQRRQPRGVKEGGQFANTANPESSVMLVDHAGIAEAERQAQIFIRRYGLTNRTVNGYMDADDLTQDAIVAFLAASQTERSADAKLPVATIAKRSIIRALDNGDHKSHSALKLYQSQLATREETLGRSLTPLEKDELAESVRLSLPLHNRPVTGFHVPKVRAVVSLDSMTVVKASQTDPGKDGVAFYERALDITDGQKPVPNLDDFEEGSSGDRAVQLKSEGKQVAARALAWNAIAEFSGAPLCVTEPIGKRVAIRARANVAEAGGPLECARTYLETGATADDLFAPFGSITDDERRTVCDTLVRHELYAEDLWRVAISQAEGRTV